MSLFAICCIWSVICSRWNKKIKWLLIYLFRVKHCTELNVALKSQVGTLTEENKYVSIPSIVMILLFSAIPKC